MSTQTKEIKEIIELVDGLEVLAIFGAKVVADGKVNHNDLPIVLEFMNKINSLFSAFDNVPEIVKEIEDIDKAEMIILLKKLLDIARNLRDFRSVTVSQ
ncbi:hypothetical protein [Pleurocapsa sp. PCC 7319]|uniref:hypothetical protein n=1 Tax=Pleurocapsa sp. PCC 7319 TaxID=118161 RepID=UPI0003470749|nr:hypothetical protein [Pleurocapsa sp. PCC 7319]